MRLGFSQIKTISAVAAVLLVAACATEPEEKSTAAGEGQAVQTQPQPTTTQQATTQPVAEPEKPKGPMPGSQEDLILNVGDRVFFAFDKFDLNAEAQDTLKRQAAWMRANPSVVITVEGHCDERGTREYNLALGERRATAVKNMLIDLGINPARVSTISYGKERPEALGSNEAAWAQNRRGVTIVN